MSVAVARGIGPTPGLRARDWLTSGALHAAVAIALWQFAMTGGPVPSRVQRLELPMRWAEEPAQASASMSPAPPPPAATPAPAPARAAVPTEKPSASQARPPESRVPAGAKRRIPAPRPVPKASPVASADRIAASVSDAGTPAREPVSSTVEPALPPAATAVAAEPVPQAALAAAPPATASTPRVEGPATAAQGTPSAASTRPPAPDPAARQQWRRDLEQLMREHKRYPLQARRMRQQGVVTVQASFSPDGDLLHCDVADSSGYRSLDEAALQLVRMAAALLRSRQAPGALAQLRIPIAFELSGS